MGPKQSKDYHSEASGDGMNTSLGTGSGDARPSSAGAKRQTAVTHNGAFIGVSTPFAKPNQERPKTPIKSRKQPTPQKEEQVQETPGGQVPTGAAAGRRHGYLNKLGFQQSDGKDAVRNTTVGESTGLIKTTLEAAPLTKDSLTVVEPKKTSSEVQPSKPEPQLSTEVYRTAAVRKLSHDFEQESPTTGSPLNDAPQSASLGSQSGLKTAKKTTDPGSYDHSTLANSFKESATMQEQLVAAGEEEVPKRYTTQVATFDESLFLDKIKRFSLKADNAQEIEDQAEEPFFDITQVETGGGQDEEENKNAIVAADSQANEDNLQVDGQQKREEGLRLLDHLSKDRTGNRHRQNLLRKLTYEKIWLTPQEKPKKYETAIIFDWDDTLLCTSFINPSGYYKHVDLGKVVQQHIKLLEQTAKQMLELAIKYGRVYIITNAAEGWVEFSCHKFMPEVEPVLEKVTIISARDRYESKYPDDVTKWKLYTFLETQTDLTNGNMKNIIALGDSMMEMDAAHHLAMTFQKALIKTVKFRELPKPNELVKQLNLVIQKFDEIVNNVRNLTIRLEKKQQGR